MDGWKKWAKTCDEDFWFCARSFVRHRRIEVTVAKSGSDT